VMAVVRARELTSIALALVYGIPVPPWSPENRQNCL
jgi:hypothetical protein